MKMKKILYGVLCIILIVSAAGCGADGGTSGRTTTNQQNSVENVLQAGMAEADATGSSGDETAPSGDDARQSGLNENASSPEASPGENTVLNRLSES